jgi:hypothetical protein
VYNHKTIVILLKAKSLGALDFITGKQSRYGVRLD